MSLLTITKALVSVEFFLTIGSTEARPAELRISRNAASGFNLKFNYPGLELTSEVNRGTFLPVQTTA